MKTIGHQMASGALWMLLYRAVDRSIGLISTMILARLLVPADFGLIALAMSLAAILELLGHFSFDMALIHNQNAERRHFDTAWTFNVMFAFGIAVLLSAMAAPFSGFYGEPRLELILYVVAGATLLQGFENIGVVTFRKELAFKKDFLFMLGKRLVGPFITVGLAFALQSYIALLCGIVANKIVGVMLSYLAHDYRPQFSLAARQELFHFSKWLAIGNVLSFFRDRSSDFVVGKIAGTHGLGIFSVANEISSMPWTEVAAPINRAANPGYARLASNITALRNSYLSVLASLALVVLPMGIGIALTAPLVVPVLLGPKWLDAIPIIQTLAIHGTITGLVSNNGNLWLSIGQTRLATATQGLGLAVLLPTLLGLTYLMGATGAAFAVLLTTTLIAPLTFFWMRPILEMNTRQLVAAVSRPVVATAVMSVSVWLAVGHWAAPSNASGATTALLPLLACVAIGAITYTAVVVVLWWHAGMPDGAERFMLDKIKLKMPNAIARRLP